MELQDVKAYERYNKGSLPGEEGEKMPMNTYELKPEEQTAYKKERELKTRSRWSWEGEKRRRRVNKNQVCEIDTVNYTSNAHLKILKK